MLIELDAPVDWKARIIDLRRWGFTIKGIADAINVAPSTVQHWLDYGKEPRFEAGRALLKLHSRELGRQQKCNSK